MGDEPGGPSCSRTLCGSLQIVGSVKHINYGAGCLIFICGTQVRGLGLSMLMDILLQT